MGMGLRLTFCHSHRGGWKLVIGAMLVALLFLIVIGVPIFGALGISTLFHYFDLGRGSAVIVLFQQTFHGLSSFPFLAVPMFILAGNLMTKGGITDRLITLAKTLVGHFVGGLAQVNILVSVFFASISGSAHADVAAIGTVLIPAMEKEGYKKGFAGALTAASAVLSPLFPPSIVLVIYGATFGVSIRGLFAAGLTVSILLAAVQAVTTYVLCKRYYSAVSVQQRASIGEVVTAFKRALIPMGMPVIIIVGIFGGFFTATEASAIAALYALIVSTLVYRLVNSRDLRDIFLSSARTTAAIVILAGLARAFSYIVARRNVPSRLMSGILAISDSPIVVIGLIILVLLIAGMFVDRTTNVLLFTPIVGPILEHQFGFSGIHVAMIIVMVLGVGHLTPPVGGTLLTTSLIGNVPVESLTRHGWPYILGLVFVAILVLAVPEISEFLPSYLGIRL